MKVLLVNGGFGMDDDSGTMQLTMYALGSCLREQGHKITIVDANLYQREILETDFINDIIAASRINDVIAFTINSFTWGHIRITIKKLRESSFKGIIIAGGVHVTHAFRHILEVSSIDYLLIGEGEISLPMLINGLEKGGNIDDVPGLIYKDKKQNIHSSRLETPINLNDDIPLPAYDLVPQGAYRAFTFESSRGCNGNCSFCSIIYKKCWRGYSAESTVKRLLSSEKILRNKISDKIMDFTDDHFFEDIQRAKDILTKLENTILRVYCITLEAKLKVFYDSELCKILKKFPYLNIQVGVECGYDTGLKKIRKGIRKKDILDVAEILYKEGLNKNVFFSFIIGFPWETKEEIFETLNTVAIVKSKYKIAINCVWWLPLPSAEFEILRKIDPSFTYSIFDDMNWINNKNIFQKSRPQLSSADIQEINLIMKNFSRFGYNLKLLGGSNNK